MRSIVYAVLISVFVIGTVEYSYRVSGGLPSVFPGKTPLELQWRIQQARSDNVIYFIGDSRVDWGIADRLLTERIKQEYGLDIYAVNAGLSAGSVSKITKFILDNHPADTPGTLVLNYSPTSFYHFTTSPGETLSDLKRQDLYDHRIANYLTEKLFTYGRTPLFLFQHFEHYLKEGYTKRFGWFARTVYPEGFVNAVGGYNDGSPRIPDLSYYRVVFDKFLKNPAYTYGKKNEVKHAVRDAELLGWNVLLIRLPIGNKMLALESKLPESLHPEKIAAEMFVPFIDYEANPRTAELPSDESHLTADAARKIVPVLSQDIAKFVMTADSKSGIIIRRATLHDAPEIWQVHAASIKDMQNRHYDENTIRTWLHSLRKNDYDHAIQTKEMFVAEMNDVMKGFGRLNLESKTIEAIYVSPHTREHEIRTKILDVLEQVAFQNDVDFLKLSTSPNAVEFYEKAGYIHKDVMKHHFPNGTKVSFFQMAKTLPGVLVFHQK